MTRKQGKRWLRKLYVFAALLTGTEITFIVMKFPPCATGMTGAFAFIGVMASFGCTPELKYLSDTPSRDLRSWSQWKYPELR